MFEKRLDTISPVWVRIIQKTDGPACIFDKWYFIFLYRVGLYSLFIECINARQKEHQGQAFHQIGGILPVNNHPHQPCKDELCDHLPDVLRKSPDKPYVCKSCRQKIGNGYPCERFFIREWHSVKTQLLRPYKKGRWKQASWTHPVSTAVSPERISRLCSLPNRPYKKGNSKILFCSS